MGERIGRATALGQGPFRLATALWPIVHDRSFGAVTGEKADDWLVETGDGSLAHRPRPKLRTGHRRESGRLARRDHRKSHRRHRRRAAPRRREISRETALGAGGEAALAWSDVYDVYDVARRRISKVYLLDAVAEAPFLAGWGAFALGRRRGAQRPSPREA